MHFRFDVHMNSSVLQRKKFDGLVAIRVVVAIVVIVIAIPVVDKLMLLSIPPKPWRVELGAVVATADENEEPESVVLNEDLDTGICDEPVKDWSLFTQRFYTPTNRETQVVVVQIHQIVRTVSVDNFYFYGE